MPIDYGVYFQKGTNPAPSVNDFAQARLAGQQQQKMRQQMEYEDQDRQMQQSAMAQSQAKDKAYHDAAQASRNEDGTIDQQKFVKLVSEFDARGAQKLNDENMDKSTKQMEARGKAGEAVGKSQEQQLKNTGMIHGAAVNEIGAMLELPEEARPQAMQQSKARIYALGKQLGFTPEQIGIPDNMPTDDASLRQFGAALMTYDQRMGHEDKAATLQQQGRIADQTNQRLVEQNAATQAHNKAMEAQGWAHVNLAKQKAQGEAIPGGDVDAYSKAILEGRASWPKGRDMSDPMKREALRLAIQVDPTLNEATHAQRAQTQKAFTTGKQADAVNSMNTAMGHAAELSDLANELGNETGMTLYNKAKNYAKAQSNDTGVTAFNTVKKALADEATKVWRGTGGSEKDVQDAMSNLSADLSQKQLQRNILEFTKLMKSKQDALQSQYEKGIGGMAKVDLLNQEAIEALNKIQSRNPGSKPAEHGTPIMKGPNGKVVPPQIVQKAMKLKSMNPEADIQGMLGQMGY